jgi:magnesium-protoporphyrin O-methyltransferase
MAGCCSGHSYDEVFTETAARRDAHLYRRRGLDSTARRIVRFVARRGIPGATAIDVGGGVGVLGLELVKAGAEHVTTVELSSGYDDIATALARTAGVEERVDRRVLDFAAAAEELPGADVVVLNRVVCCYPDYDGLLRAAARRSQRLVAFSFPRRTWWTRLGITFGNWILRLRRCEFRGYVHPPPALFASVEREGFALAYEHEGLLWQVAGFERAA